LTDYFTETKAELEKKIPTPDTDEFRKMQEKIKEGLKKKENEFLLQIRNLKVLILGDWAPEAKRQVLVGVRDTLLKHGFYAQTIDAYHSVKDSGGLPPQEILEVCCINHQLIVFIDGEGKGTVTEQEYLRQNYQFQGKVLFFIEDSKFDKLKDDPCAYFRFFPTIIKYAPNELNDTVLTFAALRLYRLAEIIQLQETRGKGLCGPNYHPWKERLGRRRKTVFK